MRTLFRATLGYLLGVTLAVAPSIPLLIPYHPIPLLFSIAGLLMVIWEISMLNHVRNPMPRQILARAGYSMALFGWISGTGMMMLGRLPIMDAFVSSVASALIFAAMVWFHFIAWSILKKDTEALKATEASL